MGMTVPAEAPDIRRRIMQANKRRDTAPEMALRSGLHGLGLRFRVDYPVAVGGPRRPVRVDIALTRARIAVFVDGCFWHSCPIHGTVPRSNTEYWIPKLAENVQRDRHTDQALIDQGWVVIRVWEHEEASAVARRIEAAYIGAISKRGVRARA